MLTNRNSRRSQTKRFEAYVLPMVLPRVRPLVTLLFMRPLTWNMKMRFVTGSIITLAAASLSMAQTTPQVGSAAPEVTLPSNEGKQISLKDYRGKWVVLYFYPKDFTSGCTMEAQNFQRDLSKFSQADAVILGVSVDNA